MVLRQVIMIQSVIAGVYLLLAVGSSFYLLWLVVSSCQIKGKVSKSYPPNQNWSVSARCFSRVRMRASSTRKQTEWSTGCQRVTDMLLPNCTVCYAPPIFLWKYSAATVSVRGLWWTDDELTSRYEKFVSTSRALLACLFWPWRNNNSCLRTLAIYNGKPTIEDLSYCKRWDGKKVKL